MNRTNSQSLVAECPRSRQKRGAAQQLTAVIRNIAAIESLLYSSGLEAAGDRCSELSDRFDRLSTLLPILATHPATDPVLGVLQSETERAGCSAYDNEALLETWVAMGVISEVCAAWSMTLSGLPAHHARGLADTVRALTEDLKDHTSTPVVLEQYPVWI